VTTIPVSTSVGWTFLGSMWEWHSTQSKPATGAPPAEHCVHVTLLGSLFLLCGWSGCHLDLHAPPADYCMTSLGPQGWPLERWVLWVPSSKGESPALETNLVISWKLQKCDLSALTWEPRIVTMEMTMNFLCGVWPWALVSQGLRSHGLH
jgi:hypothetical protein